jgi:hypothetical protein
MQPEPREFVYLTEVLPAALCRCILPHSWYVCVASQRVGVYFPTAVATNNILIPSVLLRDPEINTQAHPEAYFPWSTLDPSFSLQIAKKSTSLQWTAVATRVPWTLSIRTAHQSTLRAPLQKLPPLPKPPTSQAVGPSLLTLSAAPKTCRLTDGFLCSLLQLALEARRRKPESLCRSRSGSKELAVQAKPRPSPSISVQPPNTKRAIGSRLPQPSIHDAPEAHRRTGLFGVFRRRIQPRLHRQIRYHARDTRRGPGRRRRLWQDDHHTSHRQQGPVRQERG